MANIQSISVKNLVKKILNYEPLFILDVRPKDAFDDWKVEGKNVEIINLPFSELSDQINSVKERLPSDKPIYVICAKGNSSKKATEILIEQGMDHAFSVEGGMKAFSEHLEPIKVGELTGGAIYQFVRIGKGCLSYLIVSGEEGVLIDINRMIDQYEAFISKLNIQIKHVLDTHLHADHISGGKKFADEHGVDYFLPKNDAEGVQFDYQPIKDQDVIHVGETNIKAIYTPGHTIGSVSYLVDDQYLLTGDILFIESIGRPDLAGKAGAWVSDLRHTLYETYKSLSSDLKVLPAHFSSINEMNEDGSVWGLLGQLYEKNHGLQYQEANEFEHAVTDELPPQPNSFEDIRKTNKGQQSPDNEQQREMEIGPNRCAIK